MGDASNSRFFTTASSGSDIGAVGEGGLPAINPNVARMLSLERPMLSQFITEGVAVVD
ncbi:hypothetical protein RBWH47_03814 [Rhodopirellula baltica WH47]|uniref:Uncharacterized protein n=1 Tax=Rhodopirellula baltica WH47 TaxID=991778 RepID=F2APD0_RHOBT|nr:hypothetical protein RBWH47_03814 [Rhodopirellula baltica WH47]